MYVCEFWHLVYTGKSILALSVHVFSHNRIFFATLRTKLTTDKELLLYCFRKSKHTISTIIQINQLADLLHRASHDCNCMSGDQVLFSLINKSRVKNYVWE
jgi:hypothetical protein